MEPNMGEGNEETIPAADPGAGAPKTEEGFGVEGEQPDAPPAEAGDAQADPPEDPPFRTPDPNETARPGAGD